MPCSFANYQNMYMMCSDGEGPGIFYKQNLLEAVINVSTVESWRDGHLAARSF
jgi:hypothetical protein